MKYLPYYHEFCNPDSEEDLSKCHKQRQVKKHNMSIFSILIYSFLVAKLLHKSKLFDILPYLKCKISICQCLFDNLISGTLLL